MKRRQQKQGQSLIEVVVAVGILGVALVGVVMASTFGLKSARIARERSEARHLVEVKLEEVRRQRDGDPEAWFALGSRTDPAEQIGTAPIYTLTTTYTEVLPQAQFEVVVEASWEDAEVTYRVTQTTYLSKWQ